MRALNIFSLVFFVLVAEGVKSNYKFFPELNGYLKLQRIRADFYLARMKCHLGGGFLASPENEAFLSAMQQLMIEHNLDDTTLLYTGISATVNVGDFTTITGTDVAEIDITWRRGEPDGINNKAACLTMNVAGELGDDSCDQALPYFCYKSSQNQRLLCNESEVNTLSEYKFVKRTGSCYKFHTDKTTWWEAYLVCHAEGGYLAIINDNVESLVLLELLAHHVTRNNDANETYVGVHTENKKWFTIHGQTVDEAGFGDFDSVTPFSVHRCGVFTMKGLLKEFDCNTKAPFICEKLPS